MLPRMLVRHCASYLAIHLLVIGCLVLASPGTVAAERVAPSVTAAALTLELVPVLSGLSAPLYVTHAGDGSDRLFVVEKGGLIKVAVDGEVQATPFLDIRSLVQASGPEQGLLGLAFHPQFADNGFFYVAYTGKDGTNTVARYRVAPGDPNRADPASGLTLLAIPDPAINHNGGMLAFGPRDGYLYVAMGDGGGSFDPDNRAQDTQALHGKILRLDVDGGTPYAIPASNPFVGQPGARGEIWAYGLRNPWRFSFDRATHDLFIADVGQMRWEEINYQLASSPGGENYGWDIREAFECVNAATCQSAGLQPPVAVYGHEEGDCSITGGYVYRGAASPLLQGAYLYGDFCSGRIWALTEIAGRWQSTLLLESNLAISSFGEDASGEVYVTDLSGGRVYRLSATGTTPPASIDGGHVAMGAAAPRTIWYFAEGSTMPGFDEYLTIVNPSSTAASVEITYYLTSGPPVVKTLTAPANRRTTVTVHDAPQGVGRNQDVAAKVTSNVGIVVERPMYFVYGSTIDGGHNVLGAAAPLTRWYFAEGYTGSGFDQYLTILNPDDSDASVEITYYLASGAPIVKTLTAPANRRTTVAVHETTLGVGRGQEVSAKVESTNGVAIVVERPMYFTYGNGLTGGHNVLGANTPQMAWYFAEGSTNSGFDQYLTIMNPNSTPAELNITYFLADGATLTVAPTVPPATRFTVPVHETALGVGRGQEVATRVTTTHPGGIVVERPMYFTYNTTITGGHDVMGANAPRVTWYFAEGSTATDFDEYLTIMNANDEPAQVTITYYLRDSSAVTKTTTVGPTSRATVVVHDATLGVGRGQEVSARVTTSHSGGIVVERPMYFRYR